jgi:hypothetical protein
MRKFLTFAILAIALVGGVAVYKDKLATPADEACVACG